MLGLEPRFPPEKRCLKTRNVWQAILTLVGQAGAIATPFQITY